MFLYFECQNGHRLKAEVSQAGRTSHCPRCQAPIVVPKRAPHPVTDSGIVRLLGEMEAESPSAPRQAPLPVNQAPDRSCPRCDSPLSPSARSCDACGLYVTVNAGAWNSALETAQRYVRARRRA